MWTSANAPCTRMQMRKPCTWRNTPVDAHSHRQALTHWTCRLQLQLAHAHTLLQSPLAHTACDAAITHASRIHDTASQIVGLLVKAHCDLVLKNAPEALDSLHQCSQLMQECPGDVPCNAPALHYSLHCLALTSTGDYHALAALTTQLKAILEAPSRDPTTPSCLHWMPALLERVTCHVFCAVAQFAGGELKAVRQTATEGNKEITRGRKDGEAQASGCEITWLVMDETLLLMRAATYIIHTRYIDAAKVLGSSIDLLSDIQRHPHQISGTFETLATHHHLLVAQLANRLKLLDESRAHLTLAVQVSSHPKVAPGERTLAVLTSGIILHARENEPVSRDLVEFVERLVTSNNTNTSSQSDTPLPPPTHGLMINALALYAKAVLKIQSSVAVGHGTSEAAHATHTLHQHAILGLREALALATSTAAHPHLACHTLLALGHLFAPRGPEEALTMYMTGVTRASRIADLALFLSLCEGVESCSRGSVTDEKHLSVVEKIPSLRVQLNQQISAVQNTDALKRILEWRVLV
eukprot:c10943_g1_i3.p1 GENE.c10943_g1_i3~~c10943_g1_i3.p1  ORF type:complete len:526 (+),score=122.16 c10943_g1_i3:535-2112(+)